MDKVRRLLGISVTRSRELGMVTEVVQVNGWPALILRLDGELDSVISMRVEDGLISAIYTVRNPEKLSRILEVAGVSR